MAAGSGGDLHRARPARPYEIQVVGGDRVRAGVSELVQREGVAGHVDRAVPARPVHVLGDGVGDRSAAFAAARRADPGWGLADRVPGTAGRSADGERLVTAA